VRNGPHPGGLLTLTRPFRTVASMRLTECDWCGGAIPDDVTRPGPTKRYCGRSCRQRAYEARRADPPQPLRDRRTVAFPAGVVRLTGTVHAVDPAAGVGLWGRVRTLCGLDAHPVPHPFAGVDRRACGRCVALSQEAVARLSAS
jgi:hypothetical protein